MSAVPTTKNEGVSVMLQKDQILPIGSVVTVRFPDDDGKETVALIVGHLTLRKDRKCFFDYVCVEYPVGMEEGLFYINEPDIVKILYRATDTGQLHEKWMNRKYAEYQAYYRQYHPDLRPSIDDVRAKTKNVGAILRQMRKIRFTLRCVCAIGFVIGAVLTAVLTKSWAAVTGAILFFLAGLFFGV